MVFKICSCLVSLYYIVLANMFMKLMREIGKMCSLILIFGNILRINLHTTFILQNFGLKLCQCVPMA